MYPTTHKLMTDELLSRPEIASNVAESKKYVTARLQLPEMGKTTLLYWIARGWPEVEALYQQKLVLDNYAPKLSPYSREFWLQRINPNTGQYYTIEEADWQRNSKRPIRKEYWLAKGYSEVEAEKLANDTKAQNDQRGASQSKSMSDEIRRSKSHRCEEYWILRGHTQEEARKIIATKQSTFSLEKCIEKYGKEAGTARWQERQENWKNTLNSKSVEEKQRINSKKIGKGYTVSKNEKEICEYLREAGIDIESQFCLQHTDNKFFVYDIRYKNKIIEYNGDYWHTNPMLYQESFFNNRTKLTAKETWLKDQIKTQCAISNGFDIMIVWEFDYNKDSKRILSECVTFLTK